MSNRDWTVTSPVLPQTWSEIFQQDNEATSFQSPAWMASIVMGGHFRDASRIYDTPDGQAILPLAASTRPDTFSSAASMPHGLGAGGIISNAPITPRMVRIVFDDLSRSPFLRLAIRPNARQIEFWDALMPPGWKRIARRTHILDVSGGMDTVFAQRIDSRKRNRIRKAQNAGLTVEKGNSPEFVQRFYDLYLLWSENRARSKGLPVEIARWLAQWREPLWKFSAAARGMGQSLQVYVASHEGRPVAASIFLKEGAGAVYWRGASDATLLDKWPGNDLLQYHMISDACASGCRFYHMGESGGVESLERFKALFGAEAYSYAEYVRERLPITAARETAERILGRAASALSK
jgi:hypothetical protein